MCFFGSHKANCRKYTCPKHYAKVRTKKGLRSSWLSRSCGIKTKEYPLIISTQNLKELVGEQEGERVKEEGRRKEEEKEEGQKRKKQEVKVPGAGKHR